MLGGSGNVTSQAIVTALGFTPCPDPHSHASISEIAGLQAALDGKQPSGSYSLTSHSHSGVYQPAGSYAAAVHGHAISDVTGLQTALDGKQASGSYALASHNHSGVYQPVGSYALASHNHDGVYALADHTHAGGGSDPWSHVKLAADVSRNVTTLGTTGLSFTALANTDYLIHLVGAFTSAATTTGIAMALDIPSGTVAGQCYHPISATASGSCEQVADNATTGATTGVRAANVLVPLGGEFTIAVGATGGTVTLMFRPETAVAVVLKARHTMLRWRVV